MIKLNKDNFLELILEDYKSDIIRIKNYEYKFFKKEYNFKLNYLLKHQNNKVGIHIIHQFTSGTSSAKIPYWFEKFNQFYFPTLLIYIEDRSIHGTHIQEEILNKLITNKYGIYIDYDNYNQTIRQGKKMLSERIEYLLDL